MFIWASVEERCSPAWYRDFPPLISVDPWNPAWQKAQLVLRDLIPIGGSQLETTSNLFHLNVNLRAGREKVGRGADNPPLNAHVNEVDDEESTFLSHGAGLEPHINDSKRPNADPDVAGKTPGAGNEPSAPTILHSASRDRPSSARTSTSSGVLTRTQDLLTPTTTIAIPPVESLV
ncbi:hypothetical protein BDV98DRAFT_65612 [Pterulicium gracile]|uniref:Uncharacterized protein n=1 Tax=Pterulicium gracile TaxID=1884261 RepID=A0A5C3QHZ8_9AGAR|nr:hypothetical protein BDV98DRAFT_65612 [Pterula gracilis]